MGDAGEQRDRVEQPVSHNEAKSNWLAESMDMEAKGRPLGAGGET